MTFDEMVSSLTNYDSFNDDDVDEAVRRLQAVRAYCKENEGDNYFGWPSVILRLLDGKETE